MINWNVRFVIGSKIINSDGQIEEWTQQVMLNDDYDVTTSFQMSTTGTMEHLWNIVHKIMSQLLRHCDPSIHCIEWINFSFTTDILWKILFNYCTLLQCFPELARALSHSAHHHGLLMEMLFGFMYVCATSRINKIRHLQFAQCTVESHSYRKLKHKQKQDNEIYEEYVLVISLSSLPTVHKNIFVSLNARMSTWHFSPFIHNKTLSLGDKESCVNISTVKIQWQITEWTKCMFERERERSASALSAVGFRSIHKCLYRNRAENELSVHLRPSFRIQINTFAHNGFDSKTMRRHARFSPVESLEVISFEFDSNKVNSEENVLGYILFRNQTNNNFSVNIWQQLWF